MRLFTKITRCAKLTNFYRDFVNDVKSNKKSAHLVSLNIIGCGASGESPSVCLSTSNNEKYLFNCGEDCHRLLTQQNEKISQIKHIFVTQTKWISIGGISFICQVINSTQGWLPMFHGPKQLYKSIKRILCLSILSELDFKPIDCNLKKFFENDILRVDFISITPNETKNNHRNVRDINEVLAFIGQVKARSHQTTDSNNSNTNSAAYFMILDLPTREHLTSFLESQQFKTIDKSFDIIVHFSPKDIVKKRDYRRLVSGLNSKQHIYLNESNEFSRLSSVYELQKKLNEIDEEVHPPLKMPLRVSNKSSDLMQVKTNNENISELYSKYYLMGAKSVNGHIVANDNKLNSLRFQGGLNIERLKTFPRIVFLGTVSARASMQRNNTSILVHTTRTESILLDCGEGTCSQIFRLYGKYAETVIQQIKAVFVSHLHYDHFGGLVELLRMRKKYMPADRQPLVLISPKADLKSWIFFYDNNIEAIHDDVVFVDNDSLMTEGLSFPMCKQLGVQLLRTCHVPHFNNSHAITLNIGKQKTFKLTFSSDTTPCDDLVALGRNSTLLIHEATYPDEFIHNATKNRHCTMSQAIEQSQKMNAKYTVLTHFSRRHKLPFVDHIKYNNIGIAFDFMELTENDLPKLSSLNKQYQLTL